MATPITIDALVADRERPLITAAVQRFVDCIAAATNAHQEVRLYCREAVRSDVLRPDAPPVSPDLVARGLVPSTADDRIWLFRPENRLLILSFAADFDQPVLRHRTTGEWFAPRTEWRRAWPPAQAAWVSEQFVEEPPIAVDAALAAWIAIGREIVRASGTIPFVFTIFQHVPPSDERLRSAASEALRERIRRFNLMTAELSRCTGACVIDLDHVLAKIGARTLQTDFRLTGRRALDAGAEAVVEAWLREAADEVIPHAVREAALALLLSRRPGRPTARG